MKIKTLIISASALLLGTSFAVTASPARREAAKAARIERGGRGEILTADERQKLKAAHEKAMQDPVVKAAAEKRKAEAEEFRTVMHKALLAADPTIGPILDKVKDAGGPGMLRRGEGRGPHASPAPGKTVQ